MQEGLEDTYLEIIRESSKKLLVLKTLSNFFNHKDLFAVYVRTSVIHKLFETNKDLDINKLHLFHIQYSDSLTDLFQKLKKAKEQQYLLVSDEVYINEDLIRKLEKQTAAADFKSEAQRYSRLMADKLRRLYDILAATAAQSAFSWNDVAMFATRFGNEYYREIPTGETFLRLTENDQKKTYQTQYAVVERKLLGKLNKLNFRIKFTCGLRFENEYLEVFDFIDSNERFIFINGIRSFYFLDEEMSEGLDLSKNHSSKEEIILELRQKNEMLRDRMSTLQNSLPQDVEDVLGAYLEKISGVDFLEELQNVDEQTNILRAMLNININSK